VLLSSQTTLPASLCLVPGDVNQRLLIGISFACLMYYLQFAASGFQSMHHNSVPPIPAGARIAQSALAGPEGAGERITALCLGPERP
jgi:hypothetical protein